MNLRLLYKEKFERDQYLMKIEEENDDDREGRDNTGLLRQQKEWNPMDGGPSQDQREENP